MKKIGLIALILACAVPVALAAVTNDQISVAAAYQNESSAGVNTSAPETQSALDPDLDQPTAPVGQEADAASPSLNSELKTTIDDLSQQVKNLQADVDLLHQQTRQAHRQITAIQYAIYGLAGLVILLMLWSLVKPFKKPIQISAPVLAAPAAAPGQGEYDFMGSSEAIPAKLDLARAYIAMEDFTSARETLVKY